MELTMLDIKNTKAILNEYSSETDLESILKTNHHSIFFLNLTLPDVGDLFRSIGFTPVSNSNHFFWKVYDDLILVIGIALRPFTKDGLSRSPTLSNRYWVTYSENNLNFVKHAYTNAANYIDIDDHIEESDGSVSPHYKKTLFHESFHIKNNGIDNHNLVYRYNESEHIFYSIDYDLNLISVVYMNPMEPDKPYAKSITFSRDRPLDKPISGYFINNDDLAMELDFKTISEFVSFEEINLDNFHLFWKKFTPETLSLIEMMLI